MNWCDTKLGEVLIFKNGKKRPSENGEIPVYGGNGILGFSNLANNEGRHPYPMEPLLYFHIHKHNPSTCTHFSYATIQPANRNNQIISSPYTSLSPANAA